MASSSLGSVVLLSMDLKEAETLATVLERVAGGPHTRRRYIDAIYGALRNAGVTPSDARDIHPSQACIEFT